MNCIFNSFEGLNCKDFVVKGSTNFFLEHNKENKAKLGGWHKPTLSGPVKKFRHKHKTLAQAYHLLRCFLAVPLRRRYRCFLFYFFCFYFFFLKMFFNKSKFKNSYYDTVTNLLESHRLLQWKHWSPMWLLRHKKNAFTHYCRCYLFRFLFVFPPAADYKAFFFLLKNNFLMAISIK